MEQLGYKLQLVMETMDEVYKPGEQYVHENHYYPTLKDAFAALLRIRWEQFDLDLTRQYAIYGLRYVREAAIVENLSDDRLIAKVNRDVTGISNDISRAVHLYFPEKLEKFERDTGLCLNACENYHPAAHYLLFTYQSNRYTCNKGLSAIVKAAHSDTTEQMSWQYTLHLAGKMNPDLLSDQAKQQGWHFHNTWHYAELNEALGHMLNIDLNTLDRYVAFHKVLDHHISNAFIDARDGSPLISLLRQTDMFHLHRPPKESGLYLFFHDDPFRLPQQLNIDLAQMHVVGQDAYIQIARYDQHAKAFHPSENHEKLQAHFHSAVVKFAASKQVQGFALVVERESLAGQDHLKHFETLSTHHTTVESAIAQLLKIDVSFFDKHDATEAGHFIQIKSASVVEVSTGKNVVQRFSKKNMDLIKIDMSIASLNVLKSLRPYFKQIEQLGSMHFVVGRLQTTVDTTVLKAKNKPKTVKEITNTISIRR